MKRPPRQAGGVGEATALSASKPGWLAELGFEQFGEEGAPGQGSLMITLWPQQQGDSPSSQGLTQEMTRLSSESYDASSPADLGSLLRQPASDLFEVRAVGPAASAEHPQLLVVAQTDHVIREQTGIRGFKV